MYIKSRQDIFAINSAIVFEDRIPECGNCGARFPGSIEHIVLAIHIGLECLSCGTILSWLIQNPHGLDYANGEIVCLRCERIFVPKRYDDQYCSNRCARLSGDTLL